MKARLHIVTLALIVALPWSREATAQQHLLNTFSLADGLPQSQIWDMEQDSDGFMWFATYGGGVARFDGVGFRVYTTDDGLPSNSVFGVHQDLGGGIWFATRTGVTRFDGTRFLTVAGIAEDAKVFDVTTAKDGQIWAAAESGAYLLRAGSFVPEGPMTDESVVALHASETGSVWFGTSSRGAFRLDSQGNWLQLTTSDGLPSNTVLSIAEQKDGTIWLGTELGASRLVGDTVEVFDISDGLSNNRVQSMVEDEGGLMWFGTDLGVSRFDGDTFESLDSRGLASLPVWSLATDHEKNVYIGTSGKGVYFYNHSPFTHLNGLDRFDGRTVWNIAQSPDGDYWFGLEGDLRRLSAERLHDVPMETGFLSGRSVRAVTPAPSGVMWVGTSRGVWAWEGGVPKEVFSAAGRRVNDVRSIRVGPTGDIWVATLGEGAYRLVQGSLRPVAGLGEDEVYDILEASDGSVYFMSGNGVSVLTRRGFRRLTVKDGLSNPEAITASEDRFGRIWIGTYGGGINVLKEPLQAGREPVLEVITTANGLTDDTILFQALGRDGDLWVGTNRGLNSLDVGAYDATGKVEIRRFGQYEGFVGIEGNLHAAYRDKDGAMWFGHIEGVSRISPDAVPAPTITPTATITGLRLFLETPDWQAMGHPVDSGSLLPSALELRPSENHVTFDFVGMSFRAAERVRYRHHLEGFDPDWSPPHPERLASYSNLTPGNYTFHVQASLDGLNWSTETASYSFVVLPPFWQRWWFVMLVGAVAVASLIGLFDYRTRTLRKRQRRLEVTVSDRTAALIEAREEALQALQVKGQFLANMSHEIRTPMNGVLGFASLLAETNLDQEQEEYVQIIQSSGDSLLTIINDILDYSKIEAGKTHLEASPFSPRKVLERVLDLLSARAAEKGVRLIGDVAPELPELVVGDETRLQQVLVNLVANAVKFTDEGEVSAGVTVVSDDEGTASLRFEVRDSGIGIPANRLSSLFAPFTQADASTTRRYGGTGLGLAISDRLCALMGGALRVESQVGVGSSFHFTIEMPTREAEGEAPGSAKDAFAGKRLLIATANSATGTALVRQLAFWGCGAEIAATADQATEFLATRQSYDGLIVDAALPAATKLGIAQESGGVSARPVPRVILHTVGQRAEFDCVAQITLPIKRAALFGAIESCVAAPGVADREALAAIDGVAGTSYRVLVAEDHPVNRKLIERMLVQMGHRATMVANGQEALDAVAHDSFDVVLMDVQMPVLDGLEACRRIRQAYSASERPRIVALTAAVLDSDQERCREAGMDGILAKPLSVDELKHCLAEAPPRGEGPIRQDRGPKAGSSDARRAIRNPHVPGTGPRSDSRVT